MNSFGHTIDGKERPARRVTIGALGWSYGPDRGRKLVVELCAGDLLMFRPQGTRRRYALSAFDAFSHVVRSQALAAAREKRAVRTAKRKERVR